MPRPSKTIKDYQDLAVSRGFKWHGDINKIENVFSKSKWECNNFHTWESTYVAIRRGDGCPFCRNIKCSINEVEYKKLGKIRGFEYLGPFVKNTKIKTSWKCCCGYILQANYNAIRTGSVCCKNCKYKSIKNLPLKSKNIVYKKNENDYHSLANSFGFKWLGSSVINSHSKTMWECQKGHVWETTYKLIRKGRGCPFCSKLNVKTSQDYFDLANSCGFYWIGQKPQYVRDKTRWKCEKGHIIECSYNNLSKTKSCPLCKNYINGILVSKPQKELAKILDGIINYKIGRFYIDIAKNYFNNNWAIEYDCKYWHKIKNHARDEYIVSKGWKIIHFETKNKIPSELEVLFIVNKMLKENIDILYIDLDCVI